MTEEFSYLEKLHTIYMYKNHSKPRTVAALGYYKIEMLLMNSEIVQNMCMSSKTFIADKIK